MNLESLPDDFFVNYGAFTKTSHRDIYPAIDPSDPSLSQAGKVIVITGASRGLGARGFAPSFAKARPKGLVLASRQAAEDVAELVRKLSPETKVIALAVDVNDDTAVGQLWETVKHEFGHADILVNNAASIGRGNVRDRPTSEWWQDFEVNVRGSYLITRGFLSLLPDSHPAIIINVTSLAGTVVLPGGSSYGISKLAGIQLNAFIAAENPNITCIAFHPGQVVTDATWESFKRFSQDTPELAGGTAVWLTTNKAKFLNGRFVSTNWDVEQLAEREAEIKDGDLLTMKLTGKFGAEQFQ